MIKDEALNNLIDEELNNIIIHIFNYPFPRYAFQVELSRLHNRAYRDLLTEKYIASIIERQIS